MHQPFCHGPSNSAMAADGKTARTSSLSSTGVAQEAVVRECCPTEPLRWQSAQRSWMTANTGLFPGALVMTKLVQNGALPTLALLAKLVRAGLGQTGRSRGASQSADCASKLNMPPRSTRSRYVRARRQVRGSSTGLFEVPCAEPCEAVVCRSACKKPFLALCRAPVVVGPDHQGRGFQAPRAAHRGSRRGKTILLLCQQPLDLRRSEITNTNRVQQRRQAGAGVGPGPGDYCINTKAGAGWGQSVPWFASGSGAHDRFTVRPVNPPVRGDKRTACTDSTSSLYHIGLGRPLKRDPGRGPRGP